MKTLRISGPVVGYIMTVHNGPYYNAKRLLKEVQGGWKLGLDIIDTINDEHRKQTKQITQNSKS